MSKQTMSERFSPRASSLRALFGVMGVGVICIGGVAALASFAAAAGKKELVVTTFAKATFTPFDAKKPEAGGYAVLSGDPNAGASQMLFRYPRGEYPVHTHSADYQAVVIKGQAKHWAEGKSSVDAALLGPGSYWSQPAQQKHGDSCLSDECLLFITWAGKMD
jgi:quercetin dioxygenase-like cupin family protein